MTTSNTTTPGSGVPSVVDADAGMHNLASSLSLNPTVLDNNERHINDLESHLRGLILGNKVQTASNLGSSSTNTISVIHPEANVKLPPYRTEKLIHHEGNQNLAFESLPNPLPPHLRSASPRSQRDYFNKRIARPESANMSTQKPRKRLNQAERKQVRAELDVLSPEAPTVTSMPTLPTPIASTRPKQKLNSVRNYEPNVRLPPNNLHTRNQPLRYPRDFPSQLGAQHFGALRPLQQSLQSLFDQQSQPQSPQQAQFTRPTPQHYQLFEPRGQKDPLSPVRGRMRQDQISPTPTPLHVQIDYLNRVADVEIAKAEMRYEDLQAQETLRIQLERLCRSTIALFEQRTNQEFDANSVTLQCFGSLRSGFATCTSDMDLALVSPQSKPDPASAESPIPRLLERAFLDVNYGARLLTRTRVPIIKFCEKPIPELAEALKKERVLWEETKDKPPKPMPKRQINTEYVVAKEGIKSRGGAGIGLEKTNSPNVADPRAIGYSEELIVDNPHAVLSCSLGSDASSRVRTDVQNLLDDSSRASETNTPSCVHGIQARVMSTDMRSNSLVDSPIKERSAGNVENEENEVSNRSDEELVHLYRLAIGEGWYDNSERKIIADFIDAVENYDPVKEHDDLLIARAGLRSLTDVLKRYREPRETHLDFPKTGIGIQCDINFSNHLALHNTLLLRCYSHCDPRIRPMVLFVKAWAKRRKINSPYHGTLSSYGYVLMVLHYLVNIAQPQIAPNLQLAWTPPVQGSKHEDLTCDGYDIRFWSSESEIRDFAARRMLTSNRESLGSLLRGFFHYFALQGPNVIQGGFSWAMDVLSLRTLHGLLSKKQKGWIGAKTTTTEPTTTNQEIKEVKHRFLLAIEDPFEIDHNIARTVVHSGIVAIREEFRRAHNIIQTAGLSHDGVHTDLFLEAKDHVTRQPRTFFGPHPKPEPKQTSPSQQKDKLDAGVGASTDDVAGAAKKRSFGGGAGEKRNQTAGKEKYIVKNAIVGGGFGSHDVQCITKESR
ncbi:hypothetical protein MMC06_006428 [Schaereria dolodes]|nr:hypothetical protein [Schaereria dolodes]